MRPQWGSPCGGISMILAGSYQAEDLLRGGSDFMSAWMKAT